MVIRFGLNAAALMAGLCLMAHSAQAQCYPGLPCPDGQTSQGSSGQQASPETAGSGAANQQGSFGDKFHYVGHVNPPDPWLALRTEPSSSSGQRIMKMPEGTLLRQLERRGAWWYVELTTGERGWAHSKWIKCCKSAASAVAN